MYKWSLSSTSESDQFSQGYSAPTNACIQKIPRSLSREKVLQELPQRSRSPTYDQDHKSPRPLWIITKTTVFPLREKPQALSKVHVCFQMRRKTETWLFSFKFNFRFVCGVIWSDMNCPRLWFWGLAFRCEMTPPPDSFLSGPKRNVLWILNIVPWPCKYGSRVLLSSSKGR